MQQSRSPSVSPSKQPASAISTTVTLFEQYCNGGNPFEIQADSKDDETEDVLASNGVWSVSGRKNQIKRKANLVLKWWFILCISHGKMSSYKDQLNIFIQGAVPCKISSHFN